MEKAGMTRNKKIGIAGIVIVAALALIFSVGTLVNSYKESQFAASQAESARLLNEQKVAAGVQKGLADEAAKAGAVKDVEIQQLNQQISKQTLYVQKQRTVYVQSKLVPSLRPSGAGTSDEELRRDAIRLELQIR